MTSKDGQCAATAVAREGELNMNARDVIVIGASAGGLQALTELVRALPSDLKAAVFVVRHVAAGAESNLPRLLEQAGQLKASHAVDREGFINGHIYVAPPDYHLMLEDGRIVLSNGPKENRARPAIDALFRSAALALRERVVGVVLSGNLDDGTAGLWSVKYRGGVTVVQDPNEATSASMPRSALKHVQVDHCLPAGEIGLLLAELARDPAAPVEGDGIVDDLEVENRIALGDKEGLHQIVRIGRLTHFSCPECHGPLWELQNGSFIRFRCRSGHANTAENLIAEQTEITDKLLRAALRETEENPGLGHYLSEFARQHEDQSASDFFLFETAESERKAHLIHEALGNQRKTFVVEESKWEEVIPA